MNITKGLYVKILILIGIVFSVGAFIFFYGRSPAKKLPVIEKAADFKLVNQASEEISLTTFSGKIKVLSFFYTRCIVASQCPMTTRNFQKLQKSVGAELGQNTVFLLISFDPERDTPAGLKKYGELYDVDFHNWHFLTGDKGAVDGVVNDYQIIAEKQEAGVFRHSMITFLIDRNNNLRKMYIGNTWSPEDLKLDLITLFGGRG